MKKIKIIGMPLDLGAGRRGVDMGPSALRVAGLNQRIIELGYEVEDLGNINVFIPEVLRIKQKNQKYLPEIARANQELATKVEEILESGALPIIIGGDHSCAIGSIAGISSYFRKHNERIGLIWFDAHGDMNTPETTPSGNIHGMPYAVCLGYGAPELTEICGFAPKVNPDLCVLVGARSIDEKEREVIKKSGIRVFTMRDIDERGMRRIMEEAISIVTRNTAGFHVSFDMDFVDPAYAPGVGTPSRGGATYREAHLSLEMLADTDRMISFELVEINPVLDTANQTAEFGVELVLSALGKKIL